MIADSDFGSRSVAHNSFISPSSSSTSPLAAVARMENAPLHGFALPCENCAVVRETSESFIQAVPECPWHRSRRKLRLRHDTVADGRGTRREVPTASLDHPALTASRALLALQHLVHVHETKGPGLPSELPQKIGM